ncbi:Type IV secretory pathway, VirJ component [Arboricoccus pini]|uniref:Type IV secretory pathway, VirJ component n=1 Tax=Arboricoccus pini TaxID=1963835 RepID=A0A212PVY1_9PROT|nr:AcvB/VirJ family lysyl-phosphatidylglycerol hydrolase [Arboricoccus pini]SNB51005.1 Type IV secretory pathway, VirJ component [Arboricoccus pini]
MGLQQDGVSVLIMMFSAHLGRRVTALGLASMLGMLVFAGLFPAQAQDAPVTADAEGGQTIVARADGAPVEVDGGDVLGKIRVYRPNGDIKALVYLFSDTAGWTPALDGVGRVLAEEGILTAGIELGHVLANSATPDQDCFYLVSDLEERAQEIEKNAGIADYMTPILVGVGHGGTLAYVALTQSPDATTEGIVTIDAAPSLETRQPFCGPAPFQKSVAGGFAYGKAPSLPGWWRAAVHADQNNYFPWIDRFEEAEIVSLDENATLGRAVAHIVIETVNEVHSGDGQRLADLPLVELPSQQDGDLFAIVLSGDGGWRDLDKSIGEWLAGHGVPVIGVDSLRYFWTTKSPEQIARDVSRIVKRYGDAWHRQHVILVGYSFGAGVLPATVDALPESVRNRVTQVSVLGIGPTADFEFHVTGWLGSTSAEAQDVKGPASRLDKTRVQCFYGEEEEDTLCTDPVMAGAEIIKTTGGHHFDGNYDRLAQLIREGALRRLGAAASTAATDTRAATTRSD